MDQSLTTTRYDVNAIRSDFPILSREVYGKPLVYLDNGASAQKPKQVIDAISEITSKNVGGVLTITRMVKVFELIAGLLYKKNP